MYIVSCGNHSRILTLPQSDSSEPLPLVESAISMPTAVRFRRQCSVATDRQYQLVHNPTPGTSSIACPSESVVSSYPGTMFLPSTRISRRIGQPTSPLQIFSSVLLLRSVSCVHPPVYPHLYDVAVPRAASTILACLICRNRSPALEAPELLSIHLHIADNFPLHQ